MQLRFVPGRDGELPVRGDDLQNPAVRERERGRAQLLDL
jgi:hypothetical protein